MTNANSKNILIKEAPFGVKAMNILNNIHDYHSRENPPRQCLTLGDIAELSKFEILRTPNCGKVTLQEIETVLASYGLHIKDAQANLNKAMFPSTASILRNKELKEKNDRLLRELGYLEGEVAKTDAYKNKIAELEQRIVELEQSNRRAWGLVHDAKHEQNNIRETAMKAIIQLQTEIDHLNASRETKGNQQ